MADPIDFYFDFASPYAYFALDEIERIGAEFERPVVWRPVLIWALLKAHEIAAPMEAPVKRAYLLADMERSAAFHGVQYRMPVKLPLSSHLAARLFHVVNARDCERARSLARGIFRAFFAEHRDISDEQVLCDIAANVGIPSESAREAMKGPDGRALLEAEVSRAVASEVIGSPFLIVDGERFFGADRLPQLRWHLEGKRS